MRPETRARASVPRTRSEAGLVAIGLFLAAILTGTVLTVPIAVLSPGEGAFRVGPPHPVWFVLGEMFVTALAYLVVGTGYFLAIEGTDPPVRTPTRGDVRWTLAATGFAVASTLGAIGLAGDVVGGRVAITGLVGHAAVLPGYLVDNGLLWPVAEVAVVVVATPVATELLCRGAVQTAVRPAFGTIGTVLVPTVVFLLLHVPYVHGDGTGPYLLAVLATGVGFGLAYERTRNLAVPATAAVLWNGALVTADVLGWIPG